MEGKRKKERQIERRKEGLKKKETEKILALGDNDNVQLVVLGIGLASLFQLSCFLFIDLFPVSANIQNKPCVRCRGLLWFLTKPCLKYAGLVWLLTKSLTHDLTPCAGCSTPRTAK